MVDVLHRILYKYSIVCTLSVSLYLYYIINIPNIITFEYAPNVKSCQVITEITAENATESTLYCRLHLFCKFCLVVMVLDDVLMHVDIGRVY